MSLPLADAMYSLNQTVCSVLFIHAKIVAYCQESITMNIKIIGMIGVSFYSVAHALVESCSRDNSSDTLGLNANHNYHLSHLVIFFNSSACRHSCNDVTNLFSLNLNILNLRRSEFL